MSESYPVMATRLPPLNALRTFEAAARHLSFTKAADELFVTQAAVSHQIRALEEHLGVPLFRRFNRRLALTDQGQLLLPSVREAFDALTAGVERLQQDCCSGTLSISTTPSFAARWLAPRLVRFQARYPLIETQLSATPRQVDCLREGVDCGVRHGQGTWPGLTSVELFRQELLPVCSPLLLEGERPLREPADLAHHTLIHVLTDLEDWRTWLRAVGLATIDPTRGLKFDTGPLALQSAASGAGVALSNRTIAGDDLAAGRLVVPFDFEVPVQAGFYFVAPELTADQPKVVLFRDWLLEELAAGRPQPGESGTA